MSNFTLVSAFALQYHDSFLLLGALGAIIMFVADLILYYPTSTITNTASAAVANSQNSTTTTNNNNSINNIPIVPFLTHRVPISIMDIEITNMKIRNVATKSINNDRYVRPFRMDPAAVPSSLYRAMNSFPVCRVAMMAMAVVYEATIITTGTVFHFSI
mmetsp:Transcript_16300/g.35276  ORF Transcript_16300/g.35276 Transcript_16300/m.35276 type:complete len:159 (-) Transcript_16300:421-897(-)